MNTIQPVGRRPQTLGEEIANSVSHGVGFVAAVIAAPFLVLRALRHGDAGNVAGAGVFAATAVLLYLVSTLYHALPGNRAKHVFRKLDHAAIFLLIAGTYTAFTLGVLRQLPLLRSILVCDLASVEFDRVTRITKGGFNHSHAADRPSGIRPCSCPLFTRKVISPPWT